MKSPERTDIPALTSIRFLFALMVVATHFHGFRPELGWSWAASLGNTAVSWFFVLSGFILAYNFSRLDGRAAIGRFWLSRFWRLFPAQAATILASCLLFEKNRHLVKIEPGYLLSSLTLTHTWTANPAAGQAFNVPAWSISHEWFFYLLFPALIAWGWRSAVALSLFAAGAAGLWAAQLGCWSSQAVFQDSADAFRPNCYSIVYYWPPTRLWEFALGIGLRVVAHGLRSTRLTPVFQCGGVIAAVAVFAGQDRILALAPYGFFSHFFLSWGLNVAVGCALILALSVRGPCAAALDRRPLVFLGEISFSVYMTHMLVLAYADAKGVGVAWPGAVQFSAACAVTILVSALLFLAVERPSRAWLKSALAAGRLTPASSLPAVR